MDSRLYFVLGDLLSNILVGLVAGWLCALVVGMRAAMLPVSSYEAAALGSVCGLIAIVIVWVLNNSVRGIRSVPEEN
jgi:hypothetical protein